MLNRPPPAKRLDAMQARQITLPQLREMLFESDELFDRMALTSKTKSPSPLLSGLPRIFRRIAGRQPGAVPPWPIDRAKVTVVHLHIPKSAGSSLNTHLMMLYPQSARINANEGRPEKQISAMSRQDRGRIGVVVGHTTHGLGRLLTRPVLYLAVLRSPGPRLFSFYRYIQRTPDHRYYEAVNTEAPDFGTFLELASSEAVLRREVDNGQVRRLAGPMDTTPVDTRVYLRACEHLFAPDMMFGLVENFDPFLQRLVDRGVLDKLKDVRANAAPAGETVAPGEAFAKERDRLSDTQAKLLDAFTLWDNKLYACAARQDRKMSST
ncbi:sulfotransferase family 2 domain-containing protein [Sagittula sp. NFXS13]|uniref:hypothetical protein n=1 Tax=Sagittula sp. NFXS13 TaxID=2819095 RepID=UPI0032DF252C